MTTPDLRQFCYTASQRVMTGLAQELSIQPGQHYRPAGYNASRVLSLRLAGINPAYLPQIEKMRGQLGFWAGLDDKYQVRIGHDGQAVIIEIPKPKAYWARITLDDLERRQYIRPGLVATLGLGLQDEPKRIAFNSSIMGHVLLAGETRSGKTNAQRLIGWNVAHNSQPRDAKMLIFDVANRGSEWDDFSNVPNLAHPVITDTVTALQALAWLDAEVVRRAEQRYKTPKLFVLIDELKLLLDDAPDLAKEYLERLAANAAKQGIHLILGTQYPSIKALGSTDLKRNLTTRLCGRVDDASAAVNVLGLPGSGAETLGKYGDFLMRDESGLARFTVAYLEDRRVADLPRTQLARLELPELDDLNDGPKSPPPTPGPDPLEPEHVALALFEPMGINRLSRELSIGSSKAARLKEFADTIRQWAIERGHTCLPDPYGRLPDSGREQIKRE